MVPSFGDYTDLLGVGRREKPAHLVLKNLKVFNPYTLEVRDGDVAIYKRWVACVGRDLEGERVMDLKGLYAVPGFVDAHAHPDLFYNPFTFSRYVLKLGVTSVLADIHDFSTSVGLELFLRFLLVDSPRLPVRFFIAAPVISPPNPQVEGDWLLPQDLVEELSRCSRVFSTGEMVSWINLFKGKREFLERIYPFLKAGKLMEGHTPGAKEEKLQVLAALGITSCHESISFKDVVERLRVGMWVLVREGSIRREFRSIIPELSRNEHLLSRVMLTADGIFADHMVEHGYMDFIVKRAVEEGLDPRWALRMVTLNPCEYLGVSRFLGSISPGKLADLVVTESLDNPKPKLVFKEGRLVKDMVLEIPSCYKRPPFPIYVDEGVIPKNFGDIPVMYVENKTITRLRRIHLEKERMKELDCNYLVMIDKRTGEYGGCFLQNYGYLEGGFAISVSHESHHIISLGGSEKDMILAMRRVIENGGGACVCSRGSELFFLDLSFGGTMSFLPIEELAVKLKELKELLKRLGSRLDDPLWCAVFLSLTGLPEVRITPKGMFHVKQGRIVYNG